MLETGNNFLAPGCIQFNNSCPKLVPELYMGSTDEMLSSCSPEDQVPSCHTGLSHSSSCAPHGLELVPHLLQSVHRSVHVGQRLTLFTQDIRVHCLHLSCLMVLPIHLVLRSLSQIRQIICLLFLSTAHKGGLIQPAKLGCASIRKYFQVSSCKTSRPGEQSIFGAELAASVVHAHRILTGFPSKPRCCLQQNCWCRHSLRQTAFIGLKLHQVNLDQWT